MAVAAWPQPTSRPESRSILDYIRETWSVLTRSNRDLATAARDPKFPLPGEGRWPVFVSRTADLKQIEATLRREMQPVDYGRIELRPLPPDSAAAPPGLLYLPRPYIVPGGRFNEMYGWDSFFIQMGLLRDGQIALAKDMADNFLTRSANTARS